MGRLMAVISRLWIMTAARVSHGYAFVQIFFSGSVMAARAVAYGMMPVIEFAEKAATDCNSEESGGLRNVPGLLLGRRKRR